MKARPKLIHLTIMARARDILGLYDAEFGTIEHCTAHVRSNSCLAENPWNEVLAIVANDPSCGGLIRLDPQA